MLINKILELYDNAMTWYYQIVVPVLAMIAWYMLILLIMTGFATLIALDFCKSIEKLEEVSDALFGFVILWIFTFFVIGSIGSFVLHPALGIFSLAYTIAVFRNALKEECKHNEDFENIIIKN